MVVNNEKLQQLDRFLVGFLELGFGNELLKCQEQQRNQSVSGLHDVELYRNIRPTQGLQAVCMCLESSSTSTWHITEQCKHANSTVVAGHRHGRLGIDWHSHISMRIKLALGGLIPSYQNGGLTP